MGRPAGIVEAELIDGLAQRYGQLPSTILREDISILKLFVTATMAPKDEA